MTQTAPSESSRAKSRLVPTAALIFSYPAIEPFGRNFALAGDWQAIAVGLIFTQCVGWLLYGLVRLARFDAAASIISASATSFFFWRTRFLTEDYGLVVALVSTVVLAILIGAIAHGLRRTIWRPLVMTALAVFVLLNGAVSAFEGFNANKDARGALGSAPITASANSGVEDVFIIALDAYPSVPTPLLDQGFDNRTVIDGLRAIGYQAPDYVWTPYSTTFMTLSSLFQPEAAYPPGHAFRASDLARTSLITGGYGTLFRAFAAAGFDVHYVESGWGGTRCRNAHFSCYHSPLISEYPLWLLERSSIGPVSEELYGSPWTRGTIRAMGHLRGLAETLPKNGQRDFVFGHLVAPHEPYVLSEDCEPGSFPEGADKALRLTEQLKCVNGFISDMAAQLRDPSISVIMFSDHGPETRRQMSRPSRMWSDADIRERLTGFVAMKTPSSCKGPVENRLSHYFQVMLDCTIEGGPRVDSSFVRAVAWLNQDVVVEIPEDRIDAIELDITKALLAQS